MKTLNSPQAVVARIADRLVKTLGNHRYTMWFDRSVRLSFEQQEQSLHVTAPNRFIADWVDTHFRAALLEAAAEAVGENVDLTFQVDHRPFSQRPARPDKSKRPDKPNGRPTRPYDTGDLKLRHKLDDFVVGPSNRLAYAAACRLTEEEKDDAPPSPLFIHGDFGLGKTHLLQGICQAVLDRRPEARVRYTSAEQFTNEYVSAVKRNKRDEFRRKYRRVEWLVVDDLQVLSGKPGTQQEFLHCFDAIDMNGARVALACDKHPRLMHDLSEALVSRCLSGVVAEVEPPDTATRLRIVEAMAKRRGVALREAVVCTIANNCTHSVREIEGAVNKLSALARLKTTGRADDGGLRAEPIGQSVAEQLFNSPDALSPHRVVSVDELAESVAAMFGIDPGRLLGESRHRQTVLARSLVVYLARELTPMSYPEVARAFNRGSHSFAINAVRRVNDLLTDNATLDLPDRADPIMVRDVIDQVTRHVRGA